MRKKQNKTKLFFKKMLDRGKTIPKTIVLNNSLYIFMLIESQKKTNIDTIL